MNNEPPSPESKVSKIEVAPVHSPVPNAVAEGARSKEGDESTRNLVLGVLCVVIGVPIAGVALSWAGKEAFVALATAVSIGLVVFLALQSRLLRQPNGTFLLLSLGMVLTVAIPVAVRLFESGSEIARFALTLSQAQQTGAGLAAPVRSPLAPPQTSLVSQPLAASPLPAGEPAVKAVQSPAEVAPAPDVSQPKVADAPVSPAVEKVQQSAPVDVRPDEDPQQRATRLSKEEAVKRYPGLTVPGSPEYTLYIEAYNELARLRKFDFFKDPQWFLKLAETVAQREGWKRADQVSGETAKVPVKPAVKGAPSPLPGDELALDGPHANVPSDPVEQATNRAIIEVRRRYPALGNNGSPENQIYLDSYSELKRLRPDFFEKPEWPIHLAEIVAKREGWRRQDSGPATVEHPAPVELPLPK